jgi:Cu(I)/Ag(I) efflux system membrane fusion protein
MLRKIGVYGFFLVFGLILGYLIFNTSERNTKDENQVTTYPEGRWTCSMHPKVNGEHDGACPLCAMDLVYVATAEKKDMILSESQFEMTEDALALANVETFVVDSNVVDREVIKLSGKISTNQKTDAVQTSIFNGRIEKLYTNFVGKKVYKGQEIGLIYSPELYLAQDKLLGSISYRETHKSLYDAARNTSGLWKMTDAQIDTMLTQGKPMVNFPIYTDVSGTITEILAKEGSFYKEGEPLFRTSDLREVWAVFDVYENQLDFLEKGSKLRITVRDGAKSVIRAKIDFIEPIMDENKRTVSVRAVLSNRKGNLKPGMFADATVVDNITSKSSRIKIPRSTVLWTGKRSLVYLQPYKNKPIFEMVEVQLGRRLGDYYEVIEGLSYGDEIVVEGAFTVDAAAELKGKPSMMSRRDDTDYDDNNEDGILEDVVTPIDIDPKIK